MNKFNFNKLTPFKWFVLENFPFIEADFDALTEWQLFCKLGKEMNKIINSENTLGTQMENITNAFIELQNYVNDYFKNLDVQEEINNKLNEMVEDGTLTTIINENIFNDLNNQINDLNNQIIENTNSINKIEEEKFFVNNKLNYMLNNNQIPTLLFSGDSITNGQGATTPFPTLIKKWIDNEYDTNINVINKGIRGAISQVALDDFNSYLTDNPDIIFWEYGLNDANANYNPKITADNLIRFYNKCKDNNIELIVILPTQTYKTGELIKTNYLMKELYITLKSVCKKLGIIYIDMYKEIEIYYNSNSNFISRLQPDGTHFADYTIFRNVILKTLLTSIKTLSYELNTNIITTNTYRRLY